MREGEIMKICQISLLAGVLLVSVACVAPETSGDKPHPDVVLADTVVGDFFVRSVWLYAHQSGPSFNITHTVVSLEGEDGKLTTLYMYRLEPRLWKDMHAKITYRHALSFDNSTPLRCESSDQDLFIITEIQQIK